MAIRKIFKFPAPVLREKALPVERFDQALEALVADMAETMYDAPGIGLAAPQIGESVRLIVVDITKGGPERRHMPLINPEIVAHEGIQVDEEGCLSLIDLTSMVKRFKKITVRYHDLSGAPQELTTEGRFAVVLQHEIDHLDGILFLDHLSPLKRTLYKKKIKKMMSTQKEG